MAIGIIPTRIGSRRLPGKALALIDGRPLIQHVIENARRAKSLTRLVVAADDERIAAAVRAVGATCVLTDPDLPSGTDRIAVVARELDDEIIVNVQGDEPEIAPSAIDAVVELLKNDGDLHMATAAFRLSDRAEFLSPHRVKVVTDLEGRALYFSRAPVPHQRIDPDEPEPTGVPDGALGHVGLYGYRREALLDLVARKPSPLEILERLEQLRALQAGFAIGVVVVAEAPIGIDTPEDLEAFRRRFTG